MGIVLLGLVAILFALASSRLEKFSIGGPLVFTAAGIALSSTGLGEIELKPDGETVQLVTEITLALLLFADASTIGLSQLKRHAGIPLRLLAIGLPLTIVLGGLLAHAILPGSSWAMAFLVATILAPTDAALSLAVVSDTRVPLRVRTSLNIESGLNDGIATPIVTVLIAVVAAEEGAAQGWIAEAVKTIAIAVAVAFVLCGAVAWLFGRARKKGWTSPTSEQLVVITLAVLSYAATVSLGGNGFVASFVGGAVFGVVSRREISSATHYTETTGLFLSYAVWALFGAVLVGPLLLSSWDWHALIYGVLSLTVIRMAPVALSLIGARLDRPTVLFVGWFGPRGLASIVFLTLAVHVLHVDSTLWMNELAYAAVVWTILLSVVFHGLTATPLASAYQAYMNRPGAGAAVETDSEAHDGELRQRRLSLGE